MAARVAAAPALQAVANQRRNTSLRAQLPQQQRVALHGGRLPLRWARSPPHTQRHMSCGCLQALQRLLQRRSATSESSARQEDG